MDAIEQKLDKLVKTVEKMATCEYIDSKLNELVTKEVLERSLEAVRVDIKNDVMKEVSSIQTELDKLQGEFFYIKTTNEMLTKKMENLQKEKVERQEQYDGMYYLNESLKRRVGDMEQYTRIDNIKIFGIEDTDRNETNTVTLTKVVNFINDKLDVKINPGEISTTHRIGRFRQDSNRPIICKFSVHDTKLAVLQKRKTLKGTRVVIRDDITQFTMEILEQAGKAAGVESAWVYDCKVFVRLNNGRRLRIYSNTDLSKLE